MDQGINYLWYGPQLEVYDWGITDFYKTKQTGENGYQFDAIAASYQTVDRSLNKSYNLQPGELIDNGYYYLVWGDTVTVYAYC